MRSVSTIPCLDVKIDLLRKMERAYDHLVVPFFALTMFIGSHGEESVGTGL